MSESAHAQMAYELASNFSTYLTHELVSSLSDSAQFPYERLPEKTLFNLPRMDYRTGEIVERVRFDRRSEVYRSMLIGQAMPCISIAIILVVVIAICVLLKTITCVFSLCCSKCERVFKPFPYTRGALRRTKGVMVFFAVVGFCGCFVVFSCGNVITRELTEAVSSLKEQMNVLKNESYFEIEKALVRADEDGIYDAKESNCLNDIKEEITYIESLTKEYEDEIRTNAELAENSSLGLTSVLFAVSAITTIAIVRGNWRVIVFCSIFLTMALLLTWVVFGGVTALGVALDDAHYTVKSYLNSPSDVDISTIATCADAAKSLKLVNELRAATYYAISGANVKLLEIDPFESMKLQTSSTRLMNAMFEPKLTSELCNSSSSSSSLNLLERRRRSLSKRRKMRRNLLDDDRNEQTARSKETFESFESTVCNFYNQNSSSVAKYTYVKTKEPGYINQTSGGYYMDTNAFNFNETYTRCTLAQSTDTTTFASRCFLVESSDDPWIPYDTYDFAKNNIDVARELIKVLPKAHSLVTCEYLWEDQSNKDSSEKTGLSKTEERLEKSVQAAIAMWTGEFITALSFVCMWIILMVALQRLRNEDLMIDGDTFDPEKAGYDYD
jgi:hypothetical protein